MIRPHSILVPCDFSPASDAALDQACQLAIAFQADLMLLHVISEKSRIRTAAETNADLRRHAEEQLLRLLDARSSLQVKPRFAVREGVPAREIVRCANEENIDLIVIGTHGRTGLAHVALGSVAEKVLRAAVSPVMVVRAQAPQIPSAPEQGELLEIDFTPSSDVDEGPALNLLERAISARATDVHIDPWQDDECLVRFRIDGHLARYCTLGFDVATHLIQRCKLLANLDIADPFHAHEGRLRLPSKMNDVEVRITSSPVEGGEAVSLRLFSRGNLVRQLTGLGLSELDLVKVDRILRNGEGIVLVTGPTGSGKTTTVYTMLAELNGDSRNIVSIEDPVEYQVPFVRQMAVDERHDMSMTTGLKTLLRMDPDVVFVGEIRDLEAADIAMRAASSGRYVFSTLHTRDVASTITACRDLHIDNRSLAGNLTGIINQRLVRRLCSKCREPIKPEDSDLQLFASHGLEAPAQLFRPHGCNHCLGRGFWGRVGVFEVAWINDKLRDAVAQGGTEGELRELLRSTGTATILDDALGKVRDGITSVSEVFEMSAL
jgi:type II secretory ATPase GspE/PulE/Tfp pilus assembly ATPase PilB-like protein/nucleotide-binding universal stress UspA family protein